MTHFTDFHDMSAKFDALLHNNAHLERKIPISKKHHIFMSIARIGLFRTGGIDVDLISVSKYGALFHTSHHALLNAHNKNIDITVELSLAGIGFEYEAQLVQQDTINNFYGIKFAKTAESIDDYLIEHHIHPYYSDDIPKIGSVWLHLAEI